jgi:hypothetical protein
MTDCDLVRATVMLLLQLPKQCRGIFAARARRQGIPADLLTADFAAGVFRMCQEAR